MILSFSFTLAHFKLGSSHQGLDYAQQQLFKTLNKELVYQQLNPYKNIR